MKKSTSKSKSSAHVEYQASPALMELLGKALTDKEFRAKLAAGPQGVAKGYKLNKSDMAVLKKITPEQLETHAKQLGGRAAWTIKIVISKSF